MFYQRKMIGKSLKKKMLFLIFFVCKKRKNISCSCLKHKSNREKQVIHLMIPNREKL